MLKDKLGESQKDRLPPRNKNDAKNDAADAPQPQALMRTLGPVSDLEKHLPPEWWKTLFNSLYLKTDGDVVENPINTTKEVDLLVSVTGVQPSDRLLDLCCGQGRHSIELARRGYEHVLGLDRSRYLVRLAKKRAKQLGLKVSFTEGDARRTRIGESSRDCVFLLGNSFGYFEREEDDVNLLKSVKKVLRPRGKLVLDIVDGNWLRTHFEPRSWEWIDQNHFVCRERSLSNDGSRIVSREVVVNANTGVIADQFYAERLYGIEELRALLTRLGFEDVLFHGHLLADSTRGQDVGMMSNRLFVSAIAPQKIGTTVHFGDKPYPITVIMGDHRLPDTVKKGGKYNEEDFTTINELKKALKKLKSFSFTFLDNHKTLMKTLSETPPQFVFNLCDEGYNNKALMELHVPALLEMLQIPYTGSAPFNLALCYNKAIVRAVAQECNIPVPLESYIHSSDQTATMPSIFPALLKPCCGDSSIGITQNAIVHNAQQLIAYRDYLREVVPNSPILVQEFLNGREYSVSLVGNSERFEVLPILEVDYSNLPKDLPQILGYESKWLPDSPYWNCIRYKEAELDEDNRRNLIEYSILLFERLGCRDCARFDFRTDSQGEIKLLEVNPNPGWCWDGKLNLMANFKGIQYHELLEMIIRAALDRYQIDVPLQESALARMN